MAGGNIYCHSRGECFQLVKDSYLSLLVTCSGVNFFDFLRLFSTGLMLESCGR